PNPDEPQKPAAKAPEAAAARPAEPGEPLPAGVVARLGTTRLRPGDSVERLAFSPDGTRLAAWSSGFYASHALTVYDTKTGRELRRVDLGHGHDTGEQLAWLPDGRGVALVRSRAEEPGPLIWEFTDEKADLPPGKPRPAPVRLPRDRERDLCFDVSPDGQ